MFYRYSDFKIQSVTYGVVVASIKAVNIITGNSRRMFVIKDSGLDPWRFKDDSVYNPYTNVVYDLARDYFTNAKLSGCDSASSAAMRSIHILSKEDIAALNKVNNCEDVK